MPNPFPQSLRKECAQAAGLLQTFYDQKFVPDILYKKCKGIVILHVVKVGMGISVRGGSGIVVSYDNKNNAWGAPAAIELAGGGFGTQIGGQVSDILLILNTDAAVKAFCSSTVTLGGALSIAAGPHGKNAEGDLTVNKNFAAVYSYCSSKGLFIGMSLEGTKMIIRDSANEKYYGSKKEALEILTSEQPRHADFKPLYSVLNKLKEKTKEKYSASDSPESAPARPRSTPTHSHMKMTDSSKSLCGKTSPIKHPSHAKASPGKPVKVKVVYSFQPERRADLQLLEGDIITVEEQDGEWWMGTSKQTGRFGSFPSNYVEVL
eukprot:CFRG2201T1